MVKYFLLSLKGGAVANEVLNAKNWLDNNGLGV